MKQKTTPALSKTTVLSSSCFVDTWPGSEASQHRESSSLGQEGVEEGTGAGAGGGGEREEGRGRRRGWRKGQENSKVRRGSSWQKEESRNMQEAGQEKGQENSMKTRAGAEQ